MRIGGGASQLLLASKLQGGMIKHGVLGPISRVSDLVVVDLGPRICISSKFSGDTGRTHALRTALETRRVNQ
jgi:hypothetical protein